MKILFLENRFFWLLINNRTESIFLELDQLDLMILCVDGFSKELVDKFELNLPFEKELTIPRECYLGDYPFTPDVWGSMFSGKIFSHPDRYQKNPFLKDVRLKVRNTLHKLGIQWYRLDDKVTFNKSEIIDEIHDRDKAEPTYRHFRKAIESSVIDEYKNPFKFNIPSICDTFYFGSWDSDIELHRVFKTLALSLHRFNFDIGAIYTHLIDHKAHYILKKDYEKLRKDYIEIYELANLNIDLGVDTIVVSDHSCLEVHGDYAYIGANFDFNISSILDVEKLVREKNTNK